MPLQRDLEVPRLPPPEGGHLIPPGSSLGLTQKQVCRMVAPPPGSLQCPPRRGCCGFQAWWPLDLRGEFFTVPSGSSPHPALSMESCPLGCRRS